MNTRLLCYLGLGLLTPACGHVVAESERSVLPQFQSQPVRAATVLIAPAFERSLSNPKSFSLEFGVPSSLHDQLPALRAAIQNFDAWFANGVARAFAVSNSKIAPLVLYPQLRDSYFSNLGALLNVTIDGRVRYEVPGDGFLKAANLSVDYSLVLSGLDCDDYTTVSTSVSTDSTGKSRMSWTQTCTQKCESRFIVWSYRLKQAISDGSVQAIVGCSSSEFELADAMGYEIASKAPFPTR